MNRLFFINVSNSGRALLNIIYQRQIQSSSSPRQIVNGINFLSEYPKSIYNSNINNIKFRSFSNILVNVEKGLSLVEQTPLSLDSNRTLSRSKRIFNNNIIDNTISKTGFMSFSSSTRSESNNIDEEKKYQPKERSFKTPYGHIAALEWGNQDAPNKVFCVHGWLDNAGSFEPLITSIMKHGDNANKYHFVAIDHPGCGLSSHIPPGTQYHILTIMVEMQRVIRDLGWDKLFLLSHSMGAQLSYVYSFVYPAKVRGVVGLDVDHLLSFHKFDLWPTFVERSLDEILRIDDSYMNGIVPNQNKAEISPYSKEEAIERLIEGHQNSLTEKSALVMLKRGARQVNGGYIFNRDIRHKIMYVDMRPDYNLLKRYMDNFFTSNLLIIRARESYVRTSQQISDDFFEIYRKNCKLFKRIELNGTHHVHMNNPERVAPVVCQFFEDIEAQDKGAGEQSKSHKDEIGNSKL